MSSNGERLARLPLGVAAISIVIVGLSVFLQGIAGDALSVLTAWLTVSLPIGVLVGHCVLGGADTQ